MTKKELYAKTDLRGKKYVLTWTYHPKPLNTAVANSALTIATRLGMDVTLLCPTPEYVLDERYMGWAAQNVAENGGSLTILATALAVLAMVVLSVLGVLSALASARRVLAIDPITATTSTPRTKNASARAAAAAFSSTSMSPPAGTGWR